ncbi:4,5-DOPA dioxygenase extradiol [Neisseria sp.]|uniref:4,5-DOPA-extradiol-dioxygenase n=1 Tax=Neisseria sp. TaxID=192066 RepID=UPI0035A16C5E
MKLPVIFLGHGSPMNALEQTAHSNNWRRLGAKLQTHYGSAIRAVLMVSAHWVTDGHAVTAMTAPATIHDFGGFPRALYEMQYPAAGSPKLAARIQSLLSNVRADYEWGLDHGTWGVLCHVFPDAAFPVVQLSLNSRLDTAAHLQAARKLAVLRNEGILIMASGNIVHNLYMMDRTSVHHPDTPYPWAETVRNWANRCIIRHDIAALSDQTAYPPEFGLAAPTPEHWLPLLYTIGAADENDGVELFNDDIVGKSLSMTSAVWGLGSKMAA